MSKITLSNILLSNIYSGNFEIPQKETEYLHTLINDNPQLFSQIEDNINNILSDGKINIHDIPQIVKLISTIYHLNMPNNTNIISVVRFTVDSILNSGLFPLPDIEIQIIESIVDSSLDLLQMNITGIKKDIFGFYKFCCI